MPDEPIKICVMENKGQTAGKLPINPFADWGFKYTFGREENKDLVIGFLNLLLEPEVAINDIRYLNPELLGDNPELKRCVVDVIATDAAGNRYLVEMQNAADYTIRPRLVYYACRLLPSFRCRYRASRPKRQRNVGNPTKFCYICSNQ